MAIGAPLSSSTVGAPLSSSIVAIERERVLKGIAHEAFARAAGVSIWTWRAHRRGEQRPTDATLAKYRAALANAPRPAAPSIVVGVHRLVVTRLAAELGADMAAIDAQDLRVQRPKNANWLIAARINRMALYILTVELLMDNADVARALGCTRQNVAQARDAVEDWREDPRSGAAIAKVSLELAGRAE